MHQEKQNMRALRSLALIGALMILAYGTPLAQARQGYHLVDTIAVGGEGGWDYLIADAEAGRLYVSHTTHVVVIDTKTDKVIGDIPNTNGVHGIAFDEKGGRGFISAGRDNKV